MPKIYEVRTSSGLPVFEGNHKECEEYIAQALQKGSQPGFLSIHPKYTHYNDLPEDHVEKKRYLNLILCQPWYQNRKPA